MKTVVVASNNAHKVQEIAAALDIEGWEFKSLRDIGVVSDPEETELSFEGNAKIKARAAYAVCGGRAVIADDSGISVDALDGRPGVFSARYAGPACDAEANNDKLLEELGNLPFDERSAHYECVLVFIDTDGSEYIAHGTVEGKIGFERKGEGGFGYDPLFYPNEYGGEKTFAQVSQDEKALISHRGRALRELKEKISSHA